VSFYSFKGGVGRSTLLAATAWRFARAGKKVAVIDLDLEAPGLAALFDVETRRGVLDFIVDHLATGKSDLTDCFSPAPAHPGISVFPAGAVSWSYLEKLGRLDFAGSALAPGGSAVETALRSLLQQLKREIGPDLVLIDSRSGLHDIGGLSLHGLAHLDVLVSRANAQSFTGLSIALRTIVHRRGEDTNVLVVQSFAPVDEKTREAEEGVFLTQVYQRFSEHLYASPVWGNADAPSEDADDAPHAPCVILESEALARLTSFGSVVPSIWEGEDFVALCDRIQERLEPDEDVDEEGGTE
jgi:MinD-like ATPase involved in chromosome partitioning or flagellar assembly